MSSSLNKGWELFQLFTTNSRLHIGNLEIITEVAVSVLVIVSKGKLSELSVKTMSTNSVMTGRTYTVASPVTV